MSAFSSSESGGQCRPRSGAKAQVAVLPAARRARPPKERRPLFASIYFSIVLAAIGRRCTARGVLGAMERGFMSKAQAKPGVEKEDSAAALSGPPNSAAALPTPQLVLTSWEDCLELLRSGSDEKRCAMGGGCRVVLPGAGWRRPGCTAPSSATTPCLPWPCLSQVPWASFPAAGLRGCCW